MADSRHAAVRKRVAWRLLPYLVLLYVVAYLDRTNIGMASLQMNKELGFSDEVYGLGAGIFFLGYFLLEIPGTLIVEKWSARKWISRIMISWGIVACLTAFMKTPPQFYTLRFLLGLAEAGFFPGILVYLTHWFLPEDRAKTNAIFAAGIPLANMLGSPLSGGLMRISWLGLSGWQWLLLLEGLPAIVLGVVTLFYLTDRPRDAKWLPAEDREWLESELARARATVAATGRHSLAALGDWRVAALTTCYLLGVTTTYGISFWLPKFVTNLSGIGPTGVSFLVALPYLGGTIAIVAGGFWGDRSGRPRLVAIGGFAMLGAALGAAQIQGLGVAATMALFTLAYMGYMAGFPNFWALPGRFLTGTAAAGATGLINSFGNLGGFVGPYAVGWLLTRTGNYRAAFLALAACGILSSVFAWVSGLRGGKAGGAAAREAAGANRG